MTQETCRQKNSYFGTSPKSEIVYKELKQANEIIRKTAVFFGQAKTGRPIKWQSILLRIIKIVMGLSRSAK